MIIDTSLLRQKRTLSSNWISKFITNVQLQAPTPRALHPRTSQWRKKVPRYPPFPMSKHPSFQLPSSSFNPRHQNLHEARPSATYTLHPTTHTYSSSYLTYWLTFLPPTSQIRTIAVRLVSMALTGYYKTMIRPRTHRPLSMLKYDPVGRSPTHSFSSVARMKFKWEEEEIGRCE